MYYEYKYQDKIFLLPDDASPYDRDFYNDKHLVWINEEYDNRWRGDSHPDSEYNKMMELDRKYDFNDYENAPNYVHVIYRNKYKVTKKDRKFISSESVSVYTLVEEFYNT